MKIDVIVAEIGSTTTVVNAFHGMKEENPLFLGQGVSATTVLEGDVTIGLNAAVEDLKRKLNISDLEILETFATSSAAGGLKMSVHGLVYDMTAKAAKEAALGAGANVHLVTAGKLSDHDFKKIIALRPNIVLIAGGVDFGESETAQSNAEKIARLELDIPVIYAGNIVNTEAIRDVFSHFHQENWLHTTENVYPKIDCLNVEPTRRIIQEVFERHIIHAPGMEKVKQSIDKNIIPTPGAVMLAAKLIQQEIGDLVVVDVGGATTDVHSVTNGTDATKKILLSPEPFAKRTVEGDLGVYINRQNIIDMIGMETLAKDCNMTIDSLKNALDSFLPIPTGHQVRIVERLTLEAVQKALIRHAGRYVSLYATSGKSKVAEGKDLTGVSFLIGTGGALTRLRAAKEILEKVREDQDGITLRPGRGAKILFDRDYIMASAGVLSIRYPKQALILLKKSLGL